MLVLKTVLGTVITCAILAFVLFWILPQANVQISLAVKIIILAVVPLWSILTYIPKKRALSQRVVNPSEAMIGKTGMTLEKLDSKGAVRINFEIWNAISAGEAIEEGTRVTVTEINGLLLTVREESSTEKKQGDT